MKRLSHEQLNALDHDTMVFLFEALQDGLPPRRNNCPLYRYSSSKPMP